MGSESNGANNEVEPTKRMLGRMRAIDRLLQHARKLQVPCSTSKRLVNWLPGEATHKRHTHMERVAI